ncbi:MAG TPA: tetratricopeptide repeat protein [Bryobacteraceae bacterium]|nr:tetratricopeptide repeat protein [Bryobacteraceae bacterium]
MVKRMFPRLAAGALATAMLFAQGKQPQPKSQKEVDALNAMFQAADNDARIKSANELLQKFADTDFKALALYMITTSYNEKKDHTNTIVYGERVVEADPKSAFAAHSKVMMAIALAMTTKEFDFDKEEKLGRADKLAKEAIEGIKTAPKFNPQLTDEQWEQAKKNYTGEAYTALGMTAIVRKNWDGAIANYKLSAETDPGNGPTWVRLGAAQISAGKLDDAIATLDKVIAMPGMDAAVVNYAKGEREKAVKAKGAK